MRSSKRNSALSDRTAPCDGCDDGGVWYGTRLVQRCGLWASILTSPSKKSPREDKVVGLFEKLDASASGSWMGLALVRRIVEQPGGKIWVESEGVGQGMTFRFNLANTRLQPPV